MNLWWINQHARPPIFPGGTRHFNLAKRLCLLGNDVMVINGTFDHLGPTVSQEEKNRGKDVFHAYEEVSFLSLNLPTYKGNASLGRIKNMYTFYLKLMQALSPKNSKYKKPDIIIGSTVHPWGAYAGYKLSKMYKVPFVYEIRDLWPLTLIELGRLHKWNPIVLDFDRIDKILAQNADLILTTAPLMKNYYMERWGLPENKFLWITNGTNIKFNISSNLDKFDSKLQKDDSPLRVVYTGTLGQANGIDKILQVICLNKKSLRQFEFHFWGDGPLKESLHYYIKQNNLACFIHEPVSKTKIPQVLQSADALLFYLRPSVLYKYGISLNKAADYHAAGRPIIAVGECAQNPVTESKAGIIVPSAQELPEALLKFQKMTDQEKWRMCKNGQKYAKEHYNWDKLATKLHINLQKLLKEKINDDKNVGMDLV